MWPPGEQFDGDGRQLAEGIRTAAAEAGGPAGVDGLRAAGGAGFVAGAAARHQPRPVGGKLAERTAASDGPPGLTPRAGPRRGGDGTSPGRQVPGTDLDWGKSRRGAQDAPFCPLNGTVRAR
ncbi:hypothetical protein KCH_54980 [Kitasatospora cheerisanensis KCTC 2395]|uniref:Uncharacterized protein n=1 Tax=Kitasatospora cheerisanensis KCTC 2395 TaxID=1348663 RepID=A0A066YMQ7_9ACTN|nr:hypothetical protein KCH_54980 [Kitasatospora cheerisanensis KCTC 2395]